MMIRVLMLFDIFSNHSSHSDSYAFIALKKT